MVSLSDTQALFAEVVSLLSSDSPEAEERLVATLPRLKYSLESTSTAEMQNLALSFIPLVPLLFFETPEIVNGACQVIAKFVKGVSMDILCSEYADFLQQALANPSPSIQSLAISVLSSSAVSNSDINTLLAHPLFANLLDTLSLPAYKQSQSLIQKIAHSATGLGLLLDTHWDSIQGLLDSDDLTRLRTFELMVNISGISGDALNRVRNKGCFQNLVEELGRDDVVVVVNATELLTKLASSPSAYTLLITSTPLLPKIHSFLSPNPTHSTDTHLLVTSSIKFFCALSDMTHVDFIALDAEMGILSAMAGILLETSDTGIKESVVVAVGTLGYTPALLQRLFNQKTLLNAFLETYGGAAGDVKVRCVESISILFGGIGAGAQSGEDVDERKTKYSQDLFKLLSRDPLNDFVTLSKSSILDAKIAGYAALASLLCHEWGLKVVNSSRSCLTWIMERNEREKAGKEWRYSVLQTIVNNPASPSVFEKSAFSRICDLVKLGPFYVPSEPGVAVAGA